MEEVIVVIFSTDMVALTLEQIFKSFDYEDTCPPDRS